MRRTLLPSVEIETEIDALLAGERLGVHPLELVSELGRLGVRLVLQRAVEDGVDDWLGRARYERRAEAAPGKRNGHRPRRLQTGEGRDRGRGAAGAGRLRAVHEQAVSPAQAFPRHRAAAGAGDRRVHAWPVDARRRVALRGGGAGAGLEVDGLPALPRAEGALPGLPRARPVRRSPGLPLPRCDLPARPSLRGEGGRALRLGNQRARRARPARRLPGDTRNGRRTGSSSAARSPAAASARRSWSSPTARPASSTRSSSSGRTRTASAGRQAADRAAGAPPRRPTPAVCDLAALRLHHQPQ